MPKMQPLSKQRLCAIIWIAFFVHSCTARRIRVQPEPEEEAIQYYAAEPQEEDDGRRVVLVSADQYNGLYGQPTAAPRTPQPDVYNPPSRKAFTVTTRVKEPSRSPPVQTIRNYNKVNDDGSFTFGYEAADGSFKEETRGTDCVVRGKYGYVDPDGNKREFTYVSGNPCDPNAPKDETDEAQEQEQDAGGPDNYPIRPVRPKPAITLFQNNYDQSEEEQPEPEQVLTKHQPSRRPFLGRTQYLTPTTESIYQRPRQQFISATTPHSLPYEHSVSITPRPTQLPATTYRPQLLQLPVTARQPAAILYTKQIHGGPSTPTSTLDFDAEFQKFQQENSIASPSPPKATVKANTGLGHSSSAAKPGTPNRIYSSALIFDPTSGQYKTQLYQTLPQTDGGIGYKHLIQPYVFQRPQPTPQAAYHAQQAELQYHNSAQLLAQQQRARAQQIHHAAAQQPQHQAPQQPIYYLRASPAPHPSGQIDAFLRGHNIQF